MFYRKRVIQERKIFMERRLCDFYGKTTFSEHLEIWKKKIWFFVKEYDNTVHNTNKEKLHIIQLLRTVLHMLKQFFLYSSNICL